MGAGASPLVVPGTRLACFVIDPFFILFVVHGAREWFQRISEERLMDLTAFFIYCWTCKLTRLWYKIERE